MDYLVFGLPAHALLVHFVVVLGPLAALAVLLHAFWPAARRRLGIVTPLLALVVLVLVPITQNAGEALEASVPFTPDLQRHVTLGPTLTPWAVALFVTALLLWGWHRFRGRTGVEARLTRPLRVLALVVLDVAAVVAAVGFVVDLVLIGDAGARAVWG